MSVKFDNLRRTIIHNSSATTFRKASRQWELKALPAPLQKFISCECCGTAIKRTARIANVRTRAVLIVGLVCYDTLLKLASRDINRKALPARRRFLAERKRQFLGSSRVGMSIITEGLTFVPGVPGSLRL
jgi:hypothetical protein